MEKNRIFIASSARTLALAETLRDELQTESCDAMVWDEEGRRQPGIAITGMLENAAEQFDLAVIILAKDDVTVGETRFTLQARDNCIFEAGFLSAAIGQKRCVLVSSVEQGELPPDLGEMASIPFLEPTDLTDRVACAQSVSRVAAILKDIVQRQASSAFHAHVPLLSAEELFQREQPCSHGGDLREGVVLVCDTQPRAGVEFALQVRRNMDNGINYYYFLHFSDDTIDRICQAVQVILVAGADGAGHAADFKARVSTIRKQKDRVLDDLRNICYSRSLQITLLMDEPQFCFRLHNASEPELATIYARYFERGFLLWAEGPIATAVWQSVPKYLDDSETERLFVPMKFFNLDAKQSNLFERSLDRSLSRYFPGIEEEVKRICLGGDS